MKLFFGLDFPVSARWAKDRDKFASDNKKPLRKASFELKIRLTFSGPVNSEFYGTLRIKLTLRIMLTSLKDSLRNSLSIILFP